MNSVSPERTEVQKLIDIAKEHSAKKQRDAHMKWRAAADLSRRLLGPNHDATMFCQNNVGKALIAIENYDEAIPLLETALRQAHALYGYVHFSVEHICQSLATAYRAKGDYATAYKHWMAAATSSEAQRGLQHNTTIFCLHQAARAKASAKKFDEALAIFYKVLANTEALHGKSLHTAYVARDTATCLNQLERYKEALQYWRRAFKLLEGSDKKEMAASVSRCFYWTKNKVRALDLAAQSKLVAEVEGLRDDERQYLVALGLTTAQLTAVIEHLKTTYLTGDEGDYQHAGDLRVAVQGNRKQVSDYAKRAAECCCGSYDIELRVLEPDNKVNTIKFGFSYGH
jgi:tetratricopeptide (TPR) repeat protein